VHAQTIVPEADAGVPAQILAMLQHHLTGDRFIRQPRQRHNAVWPLNLLPCHRPSRVIRVAVLYGEAKFSGLDLPFNVTKWLLRGRGTACWH
jgi:hypothetical protein